MIDDSDLELTLDVLARVRELPVDDPARVRVQRAVDGLLKDAQRTRRAERRRASATAGRSVVASTGLGATDRIEDLAGHAEPAHPKRPRALDRDRRCYVCKSPYRQVHAFYHWLCAACATDNHARRTAGTDLTGRRALVTGGRVKIGFHVARMLLRDGAEVTVTTRFPADAAARFAADPETAKHLGRLTVTEIDLRSPQQVLDLTQRLLDDGRSLDILVNNAAQTVRRPQWSYAPLVAGERAEKEITAGQAPGQLPVRAVDASGFLPDPATANSWTARVGAVDPVEVLEVQLVNVVAPYLLIDRLLPLLLGSEHERRYVVNVSAVEGWFAARYKSGAHPHTNMAKAALNMFTRTSAAELASQGVFVSSVDTGWITDEKPMPAKAAAAATGWRPPLDVIDGAARIYHPIVSGEAGEPPFGVLLKDYRVVDW
ncbi:SDR family NAD(P)-dependent oxidoreductase [Fodinicola feengrottensis]|uniref:SDR family NAD(P)-dependent oxidoreductase n=1 Tax=Fodinicola feengrottensis TaxID=435914 RepID=A0ABN2IYC6_9ACTN